jgi:hypothetical protein
MVRHLLEGDTARVAIIPHPPVPVADDVQYCAIDLNSFVWIARAYHSSRRASGTTSAFRLILSGFGVFAVVLMANYVAGGGESGK